MDMQRLTASWGHQRIFMYVPHTLLTECYISGVGMNTRLCLIKGESHKLNSRKNVKVVFVCVIWHSPAWLSLYIRSVFFSFFSFSAPADQRSSLTPHRGPIMRHCAHISPPWSHDFTDPTWTRNQYEFSLNGLARVTYPPRTERPLAGRTESY